MRNAFIALAVIVALALAGFAAVSYYSEDTHRDCVVTDKDRTTKSDSEGNMSSDARVYTENCGTFVVADTLIKGKFNSADTFGSIEEGGTYTFTTIGYRFGLTSSFPNIIEVQ